MLFGCWSAVSRHHIICICTLCCHSNRGSLLCVQGRTNMKDCGNVLHLVDSSSLTPSFILVFPRVCNKDQRCKELTEVSVENQIMSSACMTNGIFVFIGVRCKASHRCLRMTASSFHWLGCLCCLQTLVLPRARRLLAALWRRFGK